MSPLRVLDVFRFGDRTVLVGAPLDGPELSSDDIWLFIDGQALHRLEPLWAELPHPARPDLVAVSTPSDVPITHETCREHEVIVTHRRGAAAAPTAT